MKDTPAIYLGRIIDKTNFRAYIYAPDGSQKLIESWDAFEKHMETGLWFATKENAELSKSAVAEKPKAVRRKRIIKESSNPLMTEETIIEDEPALNDDMAFEVKDDDFLPKSEG